MLTVSKGILKSRMLEYFRRIEATGEELIVTDRRKPVLKISPLVEKKSLKTVFEPYQGKAIYLAPETDPETDQWEAYH